MFELLPPNTNITSQLYCQQLDRLATAIEKTKSRRCSFFTRQRLSAHCEDHPIEAA